MQETIVKPFKARINKDVHESDDDEFNDTKGSFYRCDKTIPKVFKDVDGIPKKCTAVTYVEHNPDEGRYNLQNANAIFKDNHGNTFNNLIYKEVEDVNKGGKRKSRRTRKSKKSRKGKTRKGKSRNNRRKLKRIVK